MVVVNKELRGYTKISKEAKQARFIKPKIWEYAISDQRKAPFC